jgi:NAD(P)-dependent dehydrogenase (short-subunit alcohol dehydrogenase family)
MALTMARDLGSLGIRVVSIAPSLFNTGARCSDRRDAGARAATRSAVTLIG